MANNKFKTVYFSLAKYGSATARQLSLKIKGLTSHQIGSILFILEKNGAVEKNYNIKAGCFVWKPKNLNISSINTILERLGGNKMSKETGTEAPMVKYKGEFISVEEYEEKTKAAAKPVGKLEQERWLPLLKFLSKQEAPVPLKTIIAEVGPKVANSIYTLRTKGYVVMLHRKYGITPKGEQYIAEIESKIKSVPAVSPAPTPAAKPSPQPKKKEEAKPEEIFEE